jgi:XTP/dITP diphosphohydrolase
MAPTWFYNTTNDEKRREFQHVLGSSTQLGYLRVPITEILEMELEKVIEAKALAAYRATRVPVIVEHGALCIEALNGLPGALVKPFWESLGTRLCEVVPAGHRAARARGALCYCDGRQRHVLFAETEGEIAPSARGSGGFHWDPIFIPKGETRTFAEMTLDEKLAFSPFGKLHTQLREKLGL